MERPDNTDQPLQKSHPEDVITEEKDIDEILGDSFPASDAPPWTLGVSSARSTSTENQTGSATELDDDREPDVL